MPTTVRMTWADNTNNEDGFLLERSLTEVGGYAQIARVNPNIETYDDETAEEDTTYYYRLRATRGSLFSPYSNVLNIHTVLQSLDPLDMSNLILYHDAATSFAGASHNDPVASWADLSGNGYGMLAGFGVQPLVMKTSNTSPLGLPLVRFDGVDDAMDNGADPATWPSLTLGYTFYFYGRLKDRGGFTVNFRDSDTTRPQMGYQRSGNNRPWVRTEEGGTATYDLHSSTIHSNLMQLFAVVFKTNGTVQAYRGISNGAVVALSENPNYVMGSLATKGGFFSSFIMGDLASQIWFNEAHDLATIGQVRNGLRSRYGED